ncbi:hypothetical protein B0H15DRAFT_799267 [Mycena belliarum]|uniref:Uncharacterized protein n=1 Tax=Mycena belliarum TaxID=1033014 RepID=A0AAD6U9S4_9AGAR|nr:hypothetical protein B0H15DRAFT_799267 [Mycena belliae]
MSRVPYSSALDVVVSPDNVPETLPRPADFTLVDDVARPTLAMLDPRLTKLPGYVIRHELAKQWGQLLEGLNGVELPCTMPKNIVGPVVYVTRPQHPPNRVPFFPTHAIALTTPLTILTPPNAPVTVLAIHGTVLAAHCAKIVLAAPVQSTKPGFLCLPVLRLHLQSMTAFVALRAFMYSRRADTFLTSLMPFIPAFLAKLRSDDARAIIKATQDP